MPTLNNTQHFSYPQAENGHYVKLDITDTPILSSLPQGAYASLCYMVNPEDISMSLSGANLTVENATGDSRLLLISGQLSSIEDNTAYQDTIINNQITALSASAVQITSNAKKGWLTISIDPDTTDTVYLGDSSVSNANGFILKSSMPERTISSDDLSEWYVIGTYGIETVYVIGAYTN